MAHSLRSAVEDLRDNTLSRLSNVLAKFVFVCTRRTPKGEYSHWGLARTHGTEQAQRALSEAHSHVFLDLLRTSVRELWRLVRQDDRNVGQIRELQRKQAKGLVPADVKGGSAWHLRATLKTLRALESAASEDRSHNGQVSAAGTSDDDSPHAS